MTDPAITVIIPCRATDSPEITLASLAKQTYRDYAAHVVMDYQHKGAPWARNFGLRQCQQTSPYVLFSDADIRWEATALETMMDTLVKAQHAEQQTAPSSIKQPWMTGYAYGGYYLQEQTMFDDKFRTFRGPIGNEPWSYETLLQRNFVSTMSLIRRNALDMIGPVPWDERLRRLQDWDVWLSLAMFGWRGVWTGDVTFTTKVRSGISFQSEHRDEHTGDEHGISYTEACDIVRAKHGLAQMSQRVEELTAEDMLKLVLEACSKPLTPPELDKQTQLVNNRFPVRARRRLIQHASRRGRS